LVIPDLDPSQIGLFLELAKEGKRLEDEMKALIDEREIALRYAGYALHPQGRGARIDRQAMLDKAAQIDQRLAVLQGKMDGLQYEYSHAGFDGLGVTGYPQGLTDNGQHGAGVGGNDFGAAVAAYRQSLTNIGGQDGLVQTDGPLEFAITLGAGKLLKLGAAAAAKRAAQSRISAAARVDEIHSALDPIAQSMRTAAVLETKGGTRIIAGGARDLAPAQRALIGAGEVAAKLPGAHAEVTALQHATQNGLIPTELVASRAFCAECIQLIESLGGKLVGSATAIFPK
jgi:hypothetical protein